MGKRDGKKSSGKGGAAGGKQQTSQPKCTCEHPYNCQCGNRPERPSKGHKWDPSTQQWTGKGHKQRGGGSAHVSNQVAVTTAVGKTTVQPWQRLPSQLLAEHCRREKRPPPKFLPAKNSDSGNYRYKVIVRHGKDRDRDQFFNSPGKGVANEEQAKEEVALLALLALTPTLPHERKLPEPYKTTWKNAIGSGDGGDGGGVAAANGVTGAGADSADGNEDKKPAAKTAAASVGKRDPDAGKKTATTATASAPPAGGTATGTGGGGGRRNANSSSYRPSPTSTKESASASTAAAASSNLTLPLKDQFTSVAEKRKLHNERRRLRNQKLRKREAARMANRDHTVFLSASMRRRIETLLRGDYEGGDLLLGDDDDSGDDDDEEGDSEGVGDLRAYVIDRLVHEGFSGRQAREAFRQKGAKTSDDDDDEDFDRTYEECVQWLCVHLNEEDLPEGFDPRGRTLDVVSNKAIIATSKKISEQGPSEETIPGTADVDRTSKERNEREIGLGEHEGLVLEFADAYGLSVEDAALIFARAGQDGAVDSSSSDGRPPLRARARDVLWNAVLGAAGADAGAATTDGAGYDGVTEEERRHNRETLSDELEALGAIFAPEELSIANSTVGLGSGGDDSTNGTTIVTISLPNESGENAVLLVEGATLEVYLPSDGSYPTLPPVALIRGLRWDGGRRGASVQVDLAKFLWTLTRGEPMVYELFGFASSLVLQGGVSARVDLRPFLAGDGSSPSAEVTTEGEELGASSASAPSAESQRTPTSQSDPQPAPGEASENCATASSSAGLRQRENGTTKEKQPTKTDGKQQTKRTRPGGELGIRRPRDERGSFWCVRPRDAPPAVAHPKIGTVLERARRGLPAAEARGEFLEIMKRADGAGRVVLVTGETGCGKTTQIPQFILEEAPADAKIVVAQPRRLAATGVAGRVANERGEDAPGKASVGYVVRGDVATCRNTRLLFCTTGVLLRQLQSEAALECITHIVVDEVHERHLDTDVLLGLLKQLLATSPHLRVVLMSATMDADRFAAYWGENTPRMHIPGFTHPVQDFTLEDVLRVTGYIPPKKGSKRGKRGRHLYRASSSMASPWADSEFSDNEEDDTVGAEEESCSTSEPADKPKTEDARFAGTIDIEDRLKRVDEGTIDYDMIAALVKHLLETKRDDDDGSVLIFLPGAPEISKAEQTIKRVAKGRSVQVLPLHGGLQPRDQNLVFKKSPRGCTKIILSTNVAETSITIPDCTIVIDSCKEKQSSYDPINRMPLLVERFACRDSLKQRRGRAGRVRPGTCYKLISKASFHELPEHGEPEIRRCALDQTLLSLIFLGAERGCGNFLRTLLDAPSDESIRSAVLSLRSLGAVEYKDAEAKQLVLSPLGVHLAGIPVPPSVGKLLVMGSLLGCRSAALSIAAGMSVGRSPFIRVDVFNKSRANSEELDSMQLKVIEEREKVLKSVGNSDHAMLAAVFARWNSIDGGGGAKKRYCDSLGLSFVGMRDMMQLVRQYDSSLSSVGFTRSKDADVNTEYWRIVRSCVVAALAPSQIVRVERPSAKYSETAEGAVEKDSQAKEFKFFVRATKDTTREPVRDDAQVTLTKRYHGISEERVFIHPSSVNFKVGSFGCPWLVYHELVRTTRPYLRDATECSSYALLLFGGRLDVQAINSLIVVDEWVRLSAPPRIGALINGLRQKVDKLLAEKVSNPRLDIVGSTEMKIIVKLLRGDGLGQ